MVAKILPNNEGRTIKGVIGYNEKKKEELLAIANSHAVTSEALQKQLEWIASQNTTVVDKSFHAMISLAKDENLNNETLVAIGVEYMDRLGYGKQPYAIYLHKDTDNTHIHFVSTVINCENFKKINDSFQKRNSYSIICDLAVKYGLQPVLGRRTKIGLVNGLNLKLVKIAKRKPHSLKSFTEYCADENIKVEKSNGGYVFFIADSKKGIVSGDIPMFKNKGVDRRLKANKYYRHKAQDKLKQLLSQLLEQDDTRNYTLREYIRTLNKDGVYVKISRNAAQINGLTYSIDGFNFKGSEFGDKFSWNNVKGLIKLTPLRTKINKIPLQQNINVHRPTSLFADILRNLQQIDSTVSGNGKSNAKDEQEEDLAEEHLHIE